MSVPQTLCEHFICSEKRTVPQKTCQDFKSSKKRNVLQLLFEYFSCCEKRNVPQVTFPYIRWSEKRNIYSMTDELLRFLFIIISEKRNIHLMLHKILRIRGTFFILNIFLIHIMVNDSEKFHTLWSVNIRLSFHKKGFKMAADTEKWVKTNGISSSLFWGLC